MLYAIWKEVSCLFSAGLIMLRSSESVVSNDGLSNEKWVGNNV